MRQAGVIAAAALHALEHHVDRLADDHAQRPDPGRGRRGDRRACASNRARSRRTSSGSPSTPRSAPPPEVAARLRAEGVLVSALGPQVLRACTHLDVSARTSSTPPSRSGGRRRPGRRSDGVETPHGLRRRSTPGTSTRAEARGLQSELAAEVDIVDAARPVEDGRGGRRLVQQVRADGSTPPWSSSRAGTFEVIERVGVVGRGDVPVCPGPALVPRGPGGARGVRAAEDPARRGPLRRPGVRPPAADRASPATSGSGSACRRSAAPSRGSAASTTSRAPSGATAARSIDRGEVDRGGGPDPGAGQARCSSRRATAATSKGPSPWSWRATGKYRLPVPSRLAHEYVNELRRARGRPIGLIGPRRPSRIASATASCLLGVERFARFR